jgi:hypothetical protein
MPEKFKGKKKEKAGAVVEEEHLLPGKFKGKDRSKDKDDKGKKKETHTCNHCGMKGHIKVNCWKKILR